MRPFHFAIALRHVPARCGARLAAAFLISLVGYACNTTPIETKQPPPTSSGVHAHEASDETCFRCDASKRDPNRLWCKEHGRYEDRCWECHPELRDEKRAYCEEHGLYEDECFLCDPTRASADGPTGAPATATTASPPNGELFCNEHRVPEHECGICQPERAGSIPVGDALLVRLASERSAELAGLTISRPVQVDASTTIPLLGEIHFDGNRLARITPLASGVLTEIRADVGDDVKGGDALAFVNAPGVAEAKAAYLSAQAELQMRQAAAKRRRLLVDEGVGSRSAMEEAEASLRRAQVATKLARQRLLNLGFSASELVSMDDGGSKLPLRAPFNGTVVSRSAVLGEAVDSGVALFEVADLSKVWIELSVPEEHAARIPIGTRLRTEVQALPGATIDGQVTWVSPMVDERTRMVRVRGVLPNDNRALRRGMFADVTALIDTHPNSVVLPSSAVQRINDLPFVFVRVEADLFAARRVELGARLPSDAIAISNGVRADDSVVMTGGFAIKSALLASRLGAGCTDD